MPELTYLNQYENEESYTAISNLLVGFPRESLTYGGKNLTHTQTPTQTHTITHTNIPTHTHTKRKI